MALEIVKLRPMANEEILDAIRNDGTPEYQYRIPEATQAGIQATLSALTEYRPMHNQFNDALINKIGTQLIRATSWTNPLAIFKTGFEQWGDTVEEVGFGLPTAHAWNSQADYGSKEIFSSEPQRVETDYHTINREEFYKLTVNRKLLHRAFLQNGGLSDFLTKLMGTVSTADSYDEFTVMCQLFAEYERNGGFFKINVPDVSRIESDGPEARLALRKFRIAADNLTFLSTRYNAARLPKFVAREDLVLFCTPEFKAAIDVEALAAAFNVEKMEAYGRIITIPAANFNIRGAQAVMTTKDFFVVKDTLLENTFADNPVSLNTNHFSHHHSIISASRQVPAIMFWTGPGDEIIEVSTPVTAVSAITRYDKEGVVSTGAVERGEVYQLSAEATTDGDNTAVRWSLTGNTSLYTRVTKDGVLKIGGLEQATSIKVRATATWINPDNAMADGKFTEQTLNITGDMSPVWPVGGPLTGITVKGVEVPAFSPTTFSYTVPVQGGTVTKAQVKVAGVDAGDVNIVVNEAGTVATISAPSAPGDPIYTVTVTAA